MKRISRTAGELLLVLAGLLLFAASAMASGFTVTPVPEYERDLDRVVLSLPAEDSRLDYHEGLLERFPGYSRFLVLVAESNLAEFKERLAGKPYADRVEPLPYPVKHLEEARFYYRTEDGLADIGIYHNTPWPQGTLWARDAFVSCRDDYGNSVVLVPTYQRHVALPLVNPGEQATLRFDNDFLLELRRLDIHMKKNVPLVFAGGNVLFDRIGGESVAFVGVNAVRASLALSRKIGTDLDERKLLSLFGEFFGVDRVVVLGIGRQPDTMFHLDQSMVLLPGRQVAVARMVGKLPRETTQLARLKEAGEFLDHLRAKLKGMGYAIIDMPVSHDAALNGRFPNPVVFTNKESGRLNVLLSAYRDGTQLDTSLLLGSLKRIRARGYDAGIVWTDANRDSGGAHCLFNCL